MLRTRKGLREETQETDFGIHIFFLVLDSPYSPLKTLTSFWGFLCWYATLKPETTTNQVKKNMLEEQFPSSMVPLCDTFEMTLAQFLRSKKWMWKRTAELLFFWLSVHFTDKPEGGTSWFAFEGSTATMLTFRTGYDTIIVCCCQNLRNAYQRLYKTHITSGHQTWTYSHFEQGFEFWMYTLYLEPKRTIQACMDKVGKSPWICALLLVCAQLSPNVQQSMLVVTLHPCATCRSFDGLGRYWWERSFCECVLLLEGG